MKLGILTLPLHINYGGLLQAYAMQVFLAKIGHEGIIIDRRFQQPSSLKKLGIKLKQAFSRAFWGLESHTQIVSQEDYQKISYNTNRFIKENLKTTKILKATELPLLEEYDFQGYIVGSDQVWRPAYCPDLPNYFFDFVKNKNGIKRVAYAASFGEEKWEFSPELTEQCAKLAKLFDGISVREESAIDLCKNHLGVEAIQVVDPTLTLNKDEYIRLVANDRIPKSNGNLMVYFLNPSKEKKKIVEYLAKNLGLEPISILPLDGNIQLGHPQFIVPPVTHWLRGFMDANFVLTDSFHGTAFAIIFNKPFFSIAGFGKTRIYSILNLFKSQNRLIQSVSDLTPDKIHETIDFNLLNMIRASEQERAMAFLKKSLEAN